MKYKDFLLGFLSGYIPIQEFVNCFRSNTNFRKYIDAFMPSDAIGNPNHPIWEKYSYESMKVQNFKISTTIFDRCLFNDTPSDNLNIFGYIKYFVNFTAPETVFTMKYHDEFFLYLDITQDCFEGSEVQGLVNAIVRECSALTPKKARIKIAKEKIQHLFHVCDNKRPHWIQGPEWPMGKKTPMKYVDCKRKGEIVVYKFIDVDTKMFKSIVQHYSAIMIAPLRHHHKQHRLPLCLRQFREYRIGHGRDVTHTLGFLYLRTV